MEVSQKQRETWAKSAKFVRGLLWAACILPLAVGYSFGPVSGRPFLFAVVALSFLNVWLAWKSRCTLPLNLGLHLLGEAVILILACKNVDVLLQVMPGSTMWMIAVAQFVEDSESDRKERQTLADQGAI